MTDVTATAQRNIITILAVDMAGSTRHIAALDPDDIEAFLDHWFAHVSDAIERAGGVLVSYAGDGGIAIFGWPSPFEDHADRACSAAWDIQQTHGPSLGPSGQPVLFRAGIHSGLVGLREAQRDGRSRFDVAGTTVHVAAKLQQAAPAGKVLVSAEVVKLCRSPLELLQHDAPQSLGDLRTEVYRLNARPENVSLSDVASRYRLPMINRVDELAALRALLPRAGGTGGAVALIGEAGIGKSRLAAAAVTEALAPDVRVLVFHGDAQKRTTPFAAARALIGGLFGPKTGLAGDKLSPALGGVALEAADARVIESLLGVPPVPGQERPNRTQTQIARALVSVFLALALTQPTLLMVEDLQLIDSESRQFLQLLTRASKPQPLCLLLTGRPEALDDAREVAEMVIHLEPFQRHQMEDLGRQLWPGGQPPAALLDRAIARADGVPFLLEEFLRAMETQGPQTQQRLPHSVESAIHARLQRLSPSAKALAQALSLLGEEVDIDIVKAVLAVDLSALLNDLFELERYAFVHPLTGHRTRFRHQIIAEACADTIPREQRRGLHRAAIRAITARYSDLAGRHAQLAFHAEGAGEDMAALDYLWQAGLEARRNSAAASLNLIFDRALGVIARIGEAAESRYVDFVLMAFVSMLQVGEFKKMNQHLPRTIELAQRHGRPDQVCNTQSQLGMICWFEGRYEEGLRATSAGLEMARALKSPALIFSNQIMMANILHGMGRMDQAKAALRELSDMLTGQLETARLGAPAIPKSMTFAFMSWFENATGEYLEGLGFATRALDIAVNEQDSYSEVLARSSMGRNLLMLGRNDEAVECLAVARNLSNRNGYDAIKANLTGAMAVALARTGEARQAVSLVEACLRDELHLRTGQMEVCQLYAGYAEALVSCGETERGFAALDHALAIARGIENPWLMVECLGLRGRLLAQITPGDARISADLDEQRSICARSGVVAWTMPVPDSMRSV